MRYFLTALFCFLIAGSAYAAPPEPSEDIDTVATEEEMKDIEIKAREALEEVLDDYEEIRGIDTDAVRDLEKKLLRLKNKYQGMEKVLTGIEEGYEIEELILGGDSIYIKLDNDSSFTFRYSKGIDGTASPKNDIVHFGSTITIEEGEIIEGDVVAAFGDVIVNGTVEGGVIAFSGDIYISSTGKVENGVLALSGKVKTEPGGYIGDYMWGTRYDPTDFVDYNKAVYRSMGMVFIIIFIIWIILSATCASLLKSNVKMVAKHIEDSGFLKSYFMGYLAYFLSLLIFIGLCITILGLPLALLGVPLALLAAAILSSTALSNLVGVKILNEEEYSFRTFFYGNLFLGIIPGLFFLVQVITGNLTIMVFSWIVIGIFVFIILPVGFGGVFSTRFGTRPGKAPSSKPITENSQRI